MENRETKQAKTLKEKKQSSSFHTSSWGRRIIGMTYRSLVVLQDFNEKLFAAP